MALDIFSNYAFLGGIAREAQLEAELKKKAAQADPTTVEAAPAKTKKDEAKTETEEGENVTVRNIPPKELGSTKPKDVAVTDLRTADIAPPAIAKVFNEINADTTQLDEIAARITRIRQRYLARLEQKVSDIVIARAQKLQKLYDLVMTQRNNMVRVVNEGIEVALISREAPPSKQTTKVLEYPAKLEKQRQELMELRAKLKEKMAKVNADLDELEKQAIAEGAPAERVVPQEILQVPTGQVPRASLEVKADVMSDLEKAVNELVPVAQDYAKTAEKAVVG